MTFACHCCVCLNIDNSELVEAVTVVNGYAVCKQHIDALNSEFSDFRQLLNRVRGNV